MAAAFKNKDLNYMSLFIYGEGEYPTLDFQNSALGRNMGAVLNFELKKSSKMEYFPCRG